MTLIKTKWLSWTVRVALYLPLALLVCSILAAPWITRYFAQRSFNEVQQRYQALAASGKLDQPAEGWNAVTIRSRHGGGPYMVWFWANDPKRKCFRYVAQKRTTPEGQVTWQFQDQETKAWIY